MQRLTAANLAGGLVFSYTDDAVGNRLTETTPLRCGVRPALVSQRGPPHRADDGTADSGPAFTPPYKLLSTKSNCATKNSASRRSQASGGLSLRML